MAGERTFLYDGDCAFCSSCVRLLHRWVPTTARVLPWQRADLAALGVTRQAASAAVQWAAPGRPVTAGPDAIADLLRDAGGISRVAGAVLGARPVRPLAWPVYRWIARHRDRMPGGTAACAADHGAVGQTPDNR